MHGGRAARVPGAEPSEADTDCLRDAVPAVPVTDSDSDAASDSASGGSTIGDDEKSGSRICSNGSYLSPAKLKIRNALFERLLGRVELAGTASIGLIDHDKDSAVQYFKRKHSDQFRNA